MRFRLAAGLCALWVLAGCASIPSGADPPSPSPTATQEDAAGTPSAPEPRPMPEPSPADPEPVNPTASPEPSQEPAPEAPPPTPEATPARPAWLGQRELTVRPDGFGEVRPTPPELADRRLPPPDHPELSEPDGDDFGATVGRVPDDVAARSTWTPDCPVGLDELRYVTVTFWGFDDRPHTGELLVHAGAADDLVNVFAQLYEARFPIEEMRVVDAPELYAPPTGDGNNTTAFVCRSAVGQTRWSDHAYGLAVDVNPFHNPYARDDLVLPELASAYVDRDEHRPGMIQPGDVVTTAFAEIGWGWGGDWQRSKDWMHFSASGR